MRIISNNENQTKDLALRLSFMVKPGDILCLFGELGAGKTTFVKGLAQGLKVSADKVTSPTFVFLNIYQGKLPLYHFDLYRIEDTSQLGAIGYDEFLYGQGVAVIEWAGRLGKFMPKEYLKIEMEHRGQTERGITLSAVGKRYGEFIDKIK